MRFMTVISTFGGKVQPLFFILLPAGWINSPGTEPSTGVINRSWVLGRSAIASITYSQAVEIKALKMKGSIGAL